MTTPSPVRLVRIDVDGEPGDAVVPAVPGMRYWIEISKGDQVVGVVERSAEQIGAWDSTFRGLVQEFRDVEKSSFLAQPREQLPPASVVVPTMYRRVDLLKKTVEALLHLDYPDYEIIVVDNRVGSSHEPIPEFSADGRVRIVSEGTPGVSAARNRGVAESRGDFIAFTDDDVEVDRLWLRAIAAAFGSDAGINAVSGMVRPFEIDTEPQLWFEEFYGGFTKSFRPREWSIEVTGTSDPMFPYSPGHFGAGCNMAVRRSTMERVGGFDERIGAGTIVKSGEDLKLLLDILFAGGKIAYVPSALVRHTHRRTERQFMEQVFAYGVGLTALFANLIVQEPRHLAEIAKRVPRGIKLLLFPAIRRSPSAVTSYPRWTQLVQLTGMAYGPVAFALCLVKTRLGERHSA